jgi:hypothetical protein
VRFLVIQLKSPMGDGMSSIINFFEENHRLVNATNIETTKEYAFLKILFEKEGKEVVKSFRQIVDIDNRVGGMLEKRIESNSKFLRIKDIINNLYRFSQEIEKNEVGYIDSKLKEDEDMIKSIESELEKITREDDWKSVLDMQRVADGLKARMQSKESEFMYQISKLEVPIKKYRRSVESKVLDEYIQRSLEQVLYVDPRGKALMVALKSIREELKNGKMSLKDKDEIAILVDSAIENNTIGKIIEDYSKLSLELKAQEEKISSQEVLKRKLILEGEINRLKAMIDGTNSHKKETEDRYKRMHESMNQKAKEIERLLQEIIGEKVSLDVS